MKLDLVNNQTAITKIADYLLQIAPTTYRDLRAIKKDKFITSILRDLGLISYLTHSKGLYEMCILFRDFNTKRKGIKCLVSFSKHGVTITYALGSGITYYASNDLITIGGGDEVG